MAALIVMTRNATAEWARFCVKMKPHLSHTGVSEAAAGDTVANKSPLSNYRYKSSKVCASGDSSC